MILALFLATAFQAPEDSGDFAIPLISQWFEARQGNNKDMLDQLGAKWESLIQAGQFPLEEVSAWEDRLFHGRSYKANPPEGISNIQMETGGYALSVPMEIRETDEWPLCVWLGQKPPYESLSVLADTTLQQAVWMAPYFEDDLSANWDEQGRRTLLEALGDCFRSYPVDRNRIYLASSPDDASIAQKYLSMLPHFFAGHLLLDSGEFLQPFSTSATRNPYPLEWEARFKIPGAGRSYWVQAIQFDPGAHQGAGAFLKVRVDKELNRIELMGSGVSQVDLFLNDFIVNLDQPITIVRNGVPYQCVAARKV
ncbi:MAG: hypothetical protein MK213_05275, partial [Planctomycetes bacterium]|nr:hypothetical protein [Planctomycetota bacterium]